MSAHTRTPIECPSCGGNWYADVDDQGLPYTCFRCCNGTVQCYADDGIFFIDAELRRVAYADYSEATLADGWYYDRQRPQGPFQSEDEAHAAMVDAALHLQPIHDCLPPRTAP